MTSTVSPARTGLDVAVDRPARRRGGDFGVLLHQIRYEQLGFWRNPQAVIFTFVFPAAFMAVIGAVFGGNETSDFFYGHTGLEYYVPTIAALW